MYTYYAMKARYILIIIFCHVRYKYCNGAFDSVGTAYQDSKAHTYGNNGSPDYANGCRSYYQCQHILHQA